MSDTQGRKGPPPSVAELKARVAACEAELHSSVESIGHAVEDALDWRRAVREHPVQASLLAALVGFVAAREPAALPKAVRAVGLHGIKSAVGGESFGFLGGLLRRFL